MLAHARVWAAEQPFSLPYDPDFVGQEANAPGGQPSSTPEGGAGLKIPVPGGQTPASVEPSPAGELPSWIREAGPFLLLDRPDPSRVLTTGISSGQPRDFGEFLLQLKPFEFDQARWDSMRRDQEQGTMPPPEFPAPMLPEPGYEVALATELPKPPPPELELPTYGTSLSITGRKVIGFQYSERRYTADQKTTGRPKSTNLLDINQQLQLRMQGKVGPKITVNVDYDDTKTNKQDISVVYQGDPNEVVQMASFGDIDLSLPATEFVSYNKQLFGIRVELKYKRFHAIFIGSRTKGTTKTKQFVGNTQFVTKDILDTSYTRQQYYDLSFGTSARLPLLAGSEKVYLSRVAVGQQNVNQQTLTADDLNVQTSTYTGLFTQLAPGVDYTVDYVKGILTFRRGLTDSDVIAVDVMDRFGNPISIQKSTDPFDGLGGSGRLKLIKTFGDVQISTPTEAGYQRELKTIYSVGQGQIMRDDGRGNFFLKVLNANRTEVGPSLNPLQRYPDSIYVDFENGTFQLLKPFAVVGDSSTADPYIYSRQAPVHKYTFQLDFHYRLKTFFLEPNLVLQSEVVLLDGQRLTRNSDYFIDYESGFLTFFNEDRIRTDSTVDVSYEVAPFAGIATESLLGGRVSYDVTNKWSVGSTLLYQTGSKPPTTPSVSELAKSLLVYEADSQLRDVRFASWLQGSFQGEAAQSKANPNLSKRALVENMEGVSQDDQTSLLDSSWRIASNPGGKPADPNSIIWATADEQIKKINPNTPTTQQDTQKVLQLTYDFTQEAGYGANASDEVSIVYPFSATGLDFTQKTMLELTVQQATESDNLIDIHLGGVDENADGSGILRTEDADNDLILQPSEDIGYLYAPFGKNSKRYGAGNGRIDSEDLNNNGRLDPADFSGGDFGYINGTTFNDISETVPVARPSLNWADSSKYHVLQVPLTPDPTSYAAIKQLRITIKRKAGCVADSCNKGVLRFSRIAVIGNTWLRGAAGDPNTGAAAKAAETLSVKAVNSVANPSYVPIFNSAGDGQQVFNDLYGSIDEMKKQGGTDSISEQALELKYNNLTPGTTVYTKRIFSRALNISQHQELSFLLYGDADSNANFGADVAAGQAKTFFLRAGSDRDFFEIRVPVNFRGWKKITVEQVDDNRDQIPERWEVGAGPSGTVVLSTGNPNLQQIGLFTAGLYEPNPPAPAPAPLQTSGAVWLNEIYMDKPLTRTGNALKLQADFTVPGWATFGAKYRYMDRNYETPTTVVANQDNRQDAAYLNFTRLSFLPMNFNLSRSIVVTPNTNAVGDRANLVGLLNAGKITTWAGTASGALNLGGRFPTLNLSYDRQRIDRALSTRLDDRQTYNGTLNYVPPRKRLLPRTVDLTYRYSKYRVAYEDLLFRLDPNNPNTDEFTKAYGARLSFEPWSGASFNPDYSLTTVDENRSTLLSAGRESRLTYRKSLSQSTGFNSSWPILSWLRPSASYSVATMENNILNESTSTITGRVFHIGDIKTVNRTANGNVSLTLNAAEIMPKTKLWRSFSLTNGYQLQDGDTYEKVSKDLDTRTALWIRTPLKIGANNPDALRTNLTLRDTFNSTQRWSPLEAYDIRGRKAAFKTFSLTNNFSQSIQRSETTGTPSKTVSTTLPDLIASLGSIEQLLHAERLMRNLQTNLKYSAHRVLNVGVSQDDDKSLGMDLRSLVRERFDTALSLNIRGTQNKDLRLGLVTQRTTHRDATAQTTFDIRQYRFTPKVDYQHDITTLGSGAQTANTMVITPSLLVRADLSLPRGLQLPFMKRTLAFSNRVIWTTTMSMAIRSSPVTVADNSKLLDFNSTADYEIAKNLRMAINASMSRLWHKYVKEDEYIAYQFGWTLTFQF